MPTHRHAIESYIRAKDGNRPDLLRQAFTPDATVNMAVLTSTISFPTELAGIAAIAETLVRRFNQTYENIYTFCLGEPPQEGALAHDCHWLVGMSLKETGEVRIGYGEYLWQFDPASGRVSQLTITIERMDVAPAQDLQPLMDWLQALDYPWLDARTARARAPSSTGLGPLLEALERPDWQVPQKTS